MSSVHSRGPRWSPICRGTAPVGRARAAHTHGRAPAPSLGLRVSCCPRGCGEPAVLPSGFPADTLCLGDTWLGSRRGTWCGPRACWSDVRRTPDRTRVAGGRGCDTRKWLAPFIRGRGGEAAQPGARSGPGCQPSGAAKTCTASDARHVLTCRLPGPGCLHCSHLVGLRLSPPLPLVSTGQRSRPWTRLPLQPHSPTQVTSPLFPGCVPALPGRGCAAPALTLHFPDPACL